MTKRPLLIAACILCTMPSAHAQGCAQCKDNLATTAPETQRAYRNTIALLALSGTAAFLGGIALLRRYR